MTGFVGECSVTARYAGLAMASISEGKWGIEKLCRWISMSSGRALRRGSVTYDGTNNTIPWREIEHGVRGDAQPLPEIASTGERNATSDDARFDLSLSSNVSCAGKDDFVGRPNVSADELDLVCDQQANVLDVFALTPSSRDDVPLDFVSTNADTQKGKHGPAEACKR